VIIGCFYSAFHSSVAKVRKCGISGCTRNVPGTAVPISFCTCVGKIQTARLRVVIESACHETICDR
jgi:hypothetical protein